MPHLRTLPTDATLKDLREAFSEPLVELRPFAEALMRGDSALDKGQRELVAAYVSALNSCRYCAGVHEGVATEFGIENGLLDQLVNDLEVAPVAPELKPLLRYARKLTEAPASLTAQDAAAVYSAGWNDEALFRLVAVTAYFNMMNRLVEGAGIVGTPTQHHQSAQLLARKGYAD